MRTLLTKTFKEHKIDIYLSGHDHSLQHLRPKKVPTSLSQQGSELTPVSSGILYSKFQAWEHGFMYFSIADDKINLKAINSEGTILYETNLVKKNFLKNYHL